MTYSKRRSLARRIATSRKYRQSLKRADIANGISFQLSAMMRERRWSQRALARESGIAQPVISKYLRGYEKYSVKTLDRLADTFDVSLAVRFEPYSKLVNYHVDLRPEVIQVPRCDKDDALREMQTGPGDSMVDQTVPVQLRPGRTFVAHQALLPGQDPRVIALSEQQGTGAGKVAELA